MTQAMILMGVLAVCAVTGILIASRRGPDAPSGSYTPPTPPLPTLPPAAVVPPPPPVAAAAPRLVDVVAAPPELDLVPASPVRHGRNNGFSRFTPAAARARAGRR